MHSPKWWQRGMVGISLGALAFLYLPTAILVMFSFNDSKVTSFPPPAEALTQYTQTRSVWVNLGQKLAKRGR